MKIEKLRKVIVMPIVGIMMVSLLAGCGGNSGASTSSGTEASAPEDISGKIVIGGWPAGDEGLQAAQDRFEEKYPNIEIEYQFMATEDFRQALVTSLSAGSGAPDVAMIESAWIGELRESPALENLLDAPYNAESIKGDFTEFTWGLVTSLDGRVTAIPWDVGPATLFYRRDLFQEAGLPHEPEEVEELLSTWDGFLEAAEAVSIPGERWFVPEATDIFYWLYMNRDFFNEKLELQVDRPGAIEAYEAALKVRENGWDAQMDMWSVEANAALAGDGIVATAAGSWYGGFLKSWVSPDNQGNWGVVRLPAGLPDSNWGGSFLTIPSQSQNKEAAWAFIEFMLADPDAQNAMFEAVDYFPALTTAWDDPMYDEADDWFAGQKTRELWVEIADNVKPQFTTQIDSSIESLLKNGANTAMSEGLSGQEALDFIANSIDSAIFEERATAIDTLRDHGLWED